MSTTTTSETVHQRICPLCEACCGLEIRMADGKITSIRGDEKDVFSAGFICPKGVALKDLHEDPDRLRTPLIKRDGRFVEATWDEAFTEIDRRLPPLMAQHGKDAVAVTIGNPSAHKYGLLFYGVRLVMVHTLFDENLVKLGRLAEHVVGVDALQAAVQGFAPETVAARCGIAAATIRDLARTLALTERAAVYGRIGTCVQSFGTLNSWLVDVLNVLTGHLDEPGGAMFAKAAAFAANTAGKSGSGRGIITGRWKSRVSGAPEVYGEFPMNGLAEEIETPGAGQVKALITIASNPVLSA